MATCPDFGMIASLGQPLRWIMQARSRRYAARQTVAVVECGGRTVSLGALTTRAFLDDPDAMFHTDRFHPSARGYKRAAQVLVPSLLDALGLPVSERDERRAAGAVVERGVPLSLEQAALRAATHEGTEVRPAEGGRGRLRALVQRRRRDPGDAQVHLAGRSGLTLDRRQQGPGLLRLCYQLPDRPVQRDHR